MDISKLPEIKAEDILDKEAEKKFSDLHDRSEHEMKHRTKGFPILTKIAHMQNLYQSKGDVYSEGSTQAIKRKIRAQTIQRVPDGEIVTQYDKNSIEQVEIEYIFKNKIMTSEYSGKDMLKSLLKMFDAAYDYGFSCVRTGFEPDIDDDVRVSQTMIQWNDVWPDPDCKFIEEAEWYLVREWISMSDLEAVLDEDGNVTDSSYNQDVIHFILRSQLTDGIDKNSMPLADREKAKGPIESIEVWTHYKRGANEFETYVPDCQAILRTMKNYDPRKDVPLHFLILEPNPEYPLGFSQIIPTLAQQQFADAFQTTAYQTLLLAAQPPLMAYGNLTPSKYKMKPRAIWPMGTNPNNKIEPFRVETMPITQYSSILQNVSSNMMKNLNVADGTIASDAHVMGYSKTPQGVNMQAADKTITMNSYQKQIETFFSEWANHAIRSYLNSMTGIQPMTVDEETRRKVADIETVLIKNNERYQSIILDNKIFVDFDKLSSDLLEFKVRAGSLIQSRREEEIDTINSMLVPVSQMLPAVSDDNKKLFEDNIMKMVARLFELSDIDISVQMADPINDSMAMKALQATMEEVMNQGQQINMMQQQMGQMMPPQQPQPGMEGGMPTDPSMMGGMPPIGPEGMPMPPDQGIPGGMPPEMQIPGGGEVPAEFPAPQPGVV